MGIDELKDIIREVLSEKEMSSHVRTRSRKSYQRTKRKNIETSKLLIYFASIIYTATWIVAAYSWFSMGSQPDELMKYSTYLYGTALAIYGGKSAFENKAKIEGAYEQEVNRPERSDYP
jgi:hypothetical protein